MVSKSDEDIDKEIAVATGVSIEQLRAILDLTRLYKRRAKTKLKKEGL